MCRPEAAKLIVRPQRSHQTQARVFRTAQEQMADLVRDRATEQRREFRRGACRNCTDRRKINCHQYTAALLAIEHRFAERDDAFACCGCAIDESQHEIASLDERFRARRTTRISGNPAFDPSQRDTGRRKNIVGLQLGGSELFGRQGGVVVGPDRYGGVRSWRGVDRGNVRDDQQQHEAKRRVHASTVRSPIECLNAREVTGRRNVGDLLIH